jgi:hypothetical protein
MPSVKVKKSCCGGAGASNQQRSLADIFPPPIRLSSGTPEPPEPTVVRVENDAVQELSDMPGGVSGLRPINRPRSSSRVSEHCMNRSSRMFRPRSHHDSLHATQTVHSQHSTTRNEIPAGERPISEAPARSRDTIHSTGRVWSINSGNDVDEDHHRDDIVEHLDVIGMLSHTIFMNDCEMAILSRSSSSNSVELNQRCQLHLDVMLYTFP